MRMECSEVTDRLWEYLDGELAAKEAAAVDHHMDGCPWCRQHYHCDRSFLLLVTRALSRPCSAPPALRVTIRARIAAIVLDR
jgi:mycothiol system anti-sigma-R factor